MVLSPMHSAAPAATFLPADAPARIGVVLYGGVEPIDIGATLGVVSMASRLLPKLSAVAIAESAGPVRCAGGLEVLAAYGFADLPPCDVLVVLGGPGWRAQVENPAMLAFLRRQPAATLASVCTGALILAAAGHLAGLPATTRRQALAGEAASPLDMLADAGAVPQAAQLVDAGIVTSGGVSLAIDGTLYLLGRLFGAAARDAVAQSIEYDRAFAANTQALGLVVAKA